MNQNSYPLPSVVGGYGSKDQFERERVENGQWVFWEERVEAIIKGDYCSVKPLHLELSPTYLCNFACPWCSCRSAREEWSDVDIFNRPDSSAKTVSSEEKLLNIVKELAKENVDIQWVGGEPTMHPSFYKSAKLASELGLKQCLFTNGSILSREQASQLFEANFVFIRVSLDAVDQEVHQKHHGYNKRMNYGKKVLDNIRGLIIEKQKHNYKTLIGLSFVIDDVNLADLPASMDFVESICSEFGEKSIDYIIIRPAYEFYSSQVILSPETVTYIEKMFCGNGKYRQRLEEFGVKVITPSASFERAQNSNNMEDNLCLASGWFSELNPNGDMMVCSDRYGNPEDIIGNLAQTTISDIWSSEKRQETLRKVDARKCFRRECPVNGRGYHLNDIFNNIEAMRLEGKMPLVEKWIEDLRAILPEPKHSFFL